MGKATEPADDSDRYVEVYSLVCDVVERAWQHWPAERGPDEAPVFHTSDYARKAALRVMDAIGGDADELPARSEDEIQDAETETFERLWYFRTMSTPHLRNSPEAQDAIRRIETAYGDLKLDPTSVSFIEGKLSALRWVLGDEWDNLDT